MRCWPHGGNRDTCVRVGLTGGNGYLARPAWTCAANELSRPRRRTPRTGPRSTEYGQLRDASFGETGSQRRGASSIAERDHAMVPDHAVRRFRGSAS